MRNTLSFRRLRLFNYGLRNDYKILIKELIHVLLLEDRVVDLVQCKGHFFTVAMSSIIKEFFTRHQLHLDRIGSVCTDGAPDMLGNRSEFAALIKKIPNLKITHIFFYWHPFAARTLAPDLKKTLEICVKVVNMICGCTLNHRLFQSFCEEVDQKHTVLLYHTEVRWLSRDRVLSRVFELREEIQQFRLGQKQELAGYFDEFEFVQMLACLADMFTALNCSLQVRGISKRSWLHSKKKLFCGLGV